MDRGNNRDLPHTPASAPAAAERLLAAHEFFARARDRLTFDVPAGFTDPSLLPHHDQADADPALIAAFAAIRPVRTAAVLVPVVERDELSVLFTLRTIRLADHGGQVSFPGGHIDPGDATPLAAALREAEEEVALARNLVDPIGYLDIHLTPFGHRILPVLARVEPNFALRPNAGEVDDTFEVPLRVLMIMRDYRSEARDWNGFALDLPAIRFGERSIWGATAHILRSLHKKLGLS